MFHYNIRLRSCVSSSLCPEITWSTLLDRKTSAFSEDHSSDTQSAWRLFSCLIITLSSLPSFAVRFYQPNESFAPLRVSFLASPWICFHQSRPDALSTSSTSNMNTESTIVRLMRLFKPRHDDGQNGTQRSCARILRNLTRYLLDFVLLPQQLMRYDIGDTAHVSCSSVASTSVVLKPVVHHLFVGCPHASHSSVACRLSQHQLCPSQLFVSCSSVSRTSIVQQPDKMVLKADVEGRVRRWVTWDYTSCYKGVDVVRYIRSQLPS